MNGITIKRIYDPAADEDGFRVLVDRLWPRGISKEKASLNLWAKYMAPSNELRKEYHNNLDMFESFREKYLEELDENRDTEDFIANVKSKLKESNVTLLTASKNVEENHATVLRKLIIDDTSR
ncbi:MAG: DUF488 family protein [Gudongella sp.]|nr:DUF488 family protein [Gudongella sp.]